MKVIITAFLNLILIINNNASVQEFIIGNNIFSSDFYNEISKTNKENILISPLSTQIIFALAQSGAREETAEEIQTSLHLPNTTEKTLKIILPLLKGDENYSLYTSNKIYINEKISFKKGFLKIAIQNYYCEIENINFIPPLDAANTINKWVEVHSNNKIHDVITPDDLDERTLTILINTIYFKGEWAIPFSNYSTRKEKFYKTDDDFNKVDMMHSFQKNYNYYEDTELDSKFLELPFKGHNLSMVIVLPNRKNGVSLLETKISKVFNTQRTFHYQLLNLQIPKFRIEDKIDLKQTLSNLGVKKAFDENQADFRGIVEKQIYIDKARQKTFIDVNEIGVEAAAASFIEIFYESAPEEPPKDFIADHPFIFYIKFGNVILFAGRVSEPKY